MSIKEEDDKYHCDYCQKTNNFDQIKKRRLSKTFTYICKACGGRCKRESNIQQEKINQEEIAAARDFKPRLNEAFIIPFRPKIFQVLIRGVIVLSFFNYPIFAGWILEDLGLPSGKYTNIMKILGSITVGPFIILGLSGGFLGFIESFSVSDENEVDRWPYLLNFDWVGSALLYTLVLVFLGKLWIIAFESTALLGMAVAVLFSSVVLYLLPMYSLRISLLHGVERIWLWPVIKNIGKTFIPYSKIVFLWAFLLFLCYIVEPIFHIPIAGYFLRWFAYIYCMLVSSYALGLYYRAYEEEL